MFLKSNWLGCEHLLFCSCCLSWNIYLFIWLLALPIATVSWHLTIKMQWKSTNYMSNRDFFSKKNESCKREKSTKGIFSVPSTFNRTVPQNIIYTSYCNNSQALMEKRSLMWSMNSSLWIMCAEKTSYCN